MVGSATLTRSPDGRCDDGLAAKDKGPFDASDPVVACTKVVAGTRNILCLLLFASARIGRK